MRILIACEESQTVCKAFRQLGHEAYSNDIIDCSGGHPEWHLKMDALKAISLGNWDLVIAHPPCTDIAVSGARHFKEKIADGRQQAAINFFMSIVEACEIQRVPYAIENPICIMSTHYRKPDQIIQPWQFGHGETKATCLWLSSLPLLKPTDIVEGREQRIWKLPPGPDRAKERSKTYHGIANAMADQWSEFIISGSKIKENVQLKLAL